MSVESIEWDEDEPQDPHTGEIQKIREESRAANRRGAYFWAVGIVTVVMAAGSSLGVSALLTQRSERKLCAVVITSDDTYRETPPTTPVGKKQAANFARLRDQLGCPPYEGK